MTKMTRRGALRALGAGAALLGFGAASGCGRGGRATMTGGGMMGSASGADMSAYMDLFTRHDEIRRTVEEIPGGVRTITESDAPELARRLQTHVASMYDHLGHDAEVRCMSRTLPTLFRNADRYRRELKLTPNGVVVTETSRDPGLASIIRGHAHEVSGFVREGMPAMMRRMMGAGR
jgi:hypothetical protein